MPTGPKELLARVTALENEVKAHPICMHFQKGPRTYRVLYPEGDFRTHGAQAQFANGGKIRALTLLLAAIEKEWRQ